VLRYRTETTPDLVTLNNIQPANEVRQFLQSRAEMGFVWQRSVYGVAQLKIKADVICVSA